MRVVSRLTSLTGWSWLFSCVVCVVAASTLSSDQLAIIKQRLAEGAQQSWELGARAQALLESDSLNYSVLTVGAALPPTPINPPSTLNEVFTIASGVVYNLGIAASSVQPQQLVANDSSTGDPASLGVAVMLANWTGRQSGDGLNYAQAAQNEFNFLMSNVSKTSDGALSHRADQLQLWSDSVYMVPPFLAYYGVLTGNNSAVAEAYNQIRLYRNYLRDSNAGGLWIHAVLGNGTDPGHWSTGNGWAAAGMLRVLGTIKNSPYANNFKNEQTNLANWVLEIQDGMYSRIRSNGLFGNYVDNNATFDDASSTALLASTVYRLSLLSNIHKHLPAAEMSRNALYASNSSSSTNSSTMNNLVHFDSNGWLTPVVDPYNVGIQGSQSPEGQAFVVMMQAAWSDWVNDGSRGANSCPHLGVPFGMLLWFGLGVAATLMLQA